jgi:integrase
MGVGRLPTRWDDAVSRWLAWLVLRGTRPLTIELRRKHVAMIARASGTQSPAELTRDQLLELFTGHTWSPEYRKSLRSSMTSFYTYAVTAGLVAENVADVLPPVKPPAPAPRPAPDDVWAALLAAAPPRERLMALLAAHAGLRRAEVAALHREDLIHDIGGWSLLVRGKGGKQRVVPISDELADAIREHSSGGFLFPGRIDGHLSALHVGKIISRLMPPGWSMHKLRHRYATNGYAGTGNLRAVQQALGHASVATTERYTAVTDLQVRAVSSAAAAWQSSAGVSSL